jgi:hypothetical protein
VDIAKVEGECGKKVTETRDVQSANSRNYKTLTLTILGGGRYKFGTKGYKLAF